MDGVFVSFEMEHPHFNPVVPSVTGRNQRRAKSAGDVGFIEVVPSNTYGWSDIGLGKNTSRLMDQLSDMFLGEFGIGTASNKVTTWSFVFPLKGFQLPKYCEHVKTEEDNMLFGRVIHEHMLESMVKLSGTNNSARTGYTMTIESR